MRGDLTNFTIADYGCGDGRIAVASLLAGSKKALCIDIDEDILKYAIDYTRIHYPYLTWRILFIVSDAIVIDLNNIDTVLMNPPFGVIKRNRGIDMLFLTNALKNSKIVYSLHKYSKGLVKLIEKIAEKTNSKITWFEILELEIPMIYERHRRRIYRVRVLFIVLTKR